MSIDDDIDWITHRWEHLTTSRYLGTPRPWRQQPRHHHTPTARIALLAPPTLTALPDPLHLDIHDLINHILRKTRHLATLTATELHHPPVLAYLQHHRSTDPAEELHYVQRHHHNVTDNTQTANEHTITRIRTRMTEAFAEILDGQTLDADCPWCGKPLLRIRLIGPPTQQQPVVVCEYAGCNPQPAECGKWWRGHPAWPFHEWEWLAARIGA
jgi:hypothetical protein